MEVAKMLVFLFIVIAVLLRILPHPWDLTPVGAMFLFAGARCRTKPEGILLPLVALMVSDIFVVYVLYHGQYPWVSPVTWLGFACVACLGFLLRGRFQPVATAGASLLAAIVFYLISNFVVWATSGMYPHSTTGLVTCYVAALPFLRNAALGNLVYGALLFGGFEWMRWWSATKQEKFRVVSGY
jgi:hypothetical protein